MVNPLKYGSSTSLNVMEDAELAYSVYQVLTAFAASNTGTGTISTNAGGTIIGSFDDTIRPDPVGSHPVGTEVSTSSSTLYQDLSPVDENLERPVEFSSGNIKVQNDNTLNETLITTALEELVNNGLGSYRLQPTAPTEPGTWIQIVTITDTNQSGSTSTYLWRKTTTQVPSIVRPLKAQSDGSALKVMSDEDLQTLTDRFRNRIVDTGVGQYKLQAATPSGGTWVKMGSTFYDTIHDVENRNYANSFTGSYSRNFSGTYTRNFSNSFTGFFTGSYSNSYSGSYSRNFTGFFTGSYGRSYTGFYSRSFAGFFGRNYLGTFSRNFGRNFTGFFTGSYRRFFSGRAGPYYTGSYARNFIGNFTGFFGRFFRRNVVKYYSRNYTGYYGRSFSGSYSRSFTGFFTGSYSRSFSGSYSRNFTGFFTGSFSGSYSNSYTGSYSRNFTGLTVLGTTSNVSNVALWIRTA